MVTTQDTPASLPLHKDQQLDSYAWTKTALEELWSPVQEHSETKNQRRTTRGEKEDFILPASSHPSSQHCSVSRGNFPARKRSPGQEGRATSFSSLLGQSMKGPLQFPPTQTGKAEVYKASQEHGSKVGATGSSPSVGVTVVCTHPLCSDPSRSYH